MSSKRYAEAFRVEAVKQIAERGHSVAEVASRLGVSIHSLYARRRQVEKPIAARYAETDQAAELRRVKAAPRDRGARHSKKGRSVLCQAVRVKYAFMRDHGDLFRVRSMCRVFDVHPSGYYA